MYGCVYALLKTINIDDDKILKVINDKNIKTKRLEIYDFDNRKWQLLVSKNENNLSYLQSLLYIKNDKEDKTVVLGFDNSSRRYKENDISWIWDADFERLSTMGERLDQVLVSGIRAEDMLLRLKYAGVPEDRMTILHDYSELIERMCSSEHRVFIMPTYTAMLDLRSQLQKRLGGKEFWE